MNRNIMKKAGILAAGNGTRLKAITPYKPIVKINGTSLLELTFNNLCFNKFDQVEIIFNEEEKNMNLDEIPSLKTAGIKYFYKSTLSSMHSLYEVSLRLNLKPGEHFFVSMVDSIVPKSDAKNFHVFCQSIKDDESAILATTYVEDEKPLTLKINAEGFVTEFQSPLDADIMITSGVYYLSEKTLPILYEMIENNQTKMRNFLIELINRNHKIKVFKVNKTLDIDRPEDVKSAEDFLKEV